jgi:hypothetical protein
MFKIKNYLYGIFFLLAALLSGCSGHINNTIPAGVESNLPRSHLVSIPDNHEIKAIELHPLLLQQSNWRVFREWPSGKIRIFINKNNELTEINFPRGDSVLVNLVVESSADLYLFTYDVVSNMPSGRGLNGVSEGIALWHFSFNSAQLALIASGLPLGGIDNVLQARVSGNNVDVCTINTCLRVNTNGVVQSWKPGILAGYDIVEIRFAEKNAYALLRRSPDSETGNPDYSLAPYTVVSLPYPSSGGSTFTYTVDHDCLPFRLRMEDGLPNWSCAKTPVELAEVFKGDIRRVPHGGLGDIGLNNSEGRIAWSLVYSLNALLHLDNHYTPQLAKASNWHFEKLILVNALELIAKQGVDTIFGYSSRRYSLNRKPILFALHLGRISQLLSSGELLGYGSDNIKKALKVLRAEMHSLNLTAERRMYVYPYETLGYRKGIDFWADGSNVPYNYISGYVHGFLSSVNTPENYALDMKNLLSPLINNELSYDSFQWHYWWGYGKNGWTSDDLLSLNTPDYIGSSGIAHISYRSMDAMAVLRLAKVNPMFVDEKVLLKIRNLVSSGYLLPYVNQEIIGSNGHNTIDRRVALYYGRSASPSELHAQLFALESLAGK